VTLRLLVNLTNPELLLFKEELPEDKETRNYYLQIQVQFSNLFCFYIWSVMWIPVSRIRDVHPVS
jgi:hypothetical protein